ncbi:MAG TPA: FtsW/RodA/SpoVE family cell cycle protein [Acidimicrobiia bacterium]|nr:FtsW/RodA/SpoVE family cell cycle protein [Acidimicrobiia bacterium]
MTRRREAILIAFSAAIAGVGTAATAITLGREVVSDTIGAVLTQLGAFGAVLWAITRWAPLASRLLLAPAAFITAIGCIEVYRIDRDLGRIQRWWLVVAAMVGAGVLFLLSKHGVLVLRRFRNLFLFAAVGLLLLPLLPDGLPLAGAEVNGSRLWVRLDLGDRSISFQPGEAAKLLIVVFLASFLADRWRALAEMPRRFGTLRMPEPRQLAPILMAFGIAVVVLVYQRDLGASLHLFVVFIVMLYLGTSRPSYLVAGGTLAAGGMYAAATTFSHVQVRVEAWLRPFDDYTGSGYQAAQGVFSLGNGGVFGTGLGYGSPHLVPAAATDYVFVAIVEELGLAGGLALVAAYALLVTAGFGIALRSADRFRSLLAAGLTVVIAAQTFIILAGVLRILPLTGITLPFASYGGSSLLANMALLALLARISHEERA